jgi:hypothetical protein
MRTDIVGASEIVGDDVLDGDIFGDVEGDAFVGDESAGDIDALMGAWYNPLSWGRTKGPSAQQRAMALQQQRAAAQSALARRRVSEGSILRDVAPTKSREYILGFDVTSIPGGASANITKRPQVIFRPERVIIPSTVGVNFQVLDVKVGKNSQFTASGSVPAVVFAETSFGVRLKMDTCQVSMDVTLSVQNTNANAQNFTAAIIGPAVE